MRYYLLTMDEKSYWDIPETTLWESFDEALEVALAAVFRNKTAPETEGGASNVRFELDCAQGHAYLLNGFEIFPITPSTREVITWFGKPTSANC